MFLIKYLIFKGAFLSLGTLKMASKNNNISTPQINFKNLTLKVLVLNYLDKKLLLWEVVLLFWQCLLPAMMFPNKQ